MSLHLEWRGRKRHRLYRNQNYRYIYPSQTELGLTNFYGPDRSFCKGMLFDTTDFVIQFMLNDWTNVTAIDHHQGSYHGNLTRNNTTVTAIYIKHHTMDYDQTAFNQHFQRIIAELPIGTKIYRYQSCEDLTGRLIVISSLWVKT
jgi:hypothetical protein